MEGHVRLCPRREHKGMHRRPQRLRILKVWLHRLGYFERIIRLEDGCDSGDGNSSGISSRLTVPPK